MMSFSIQSSSADRFNPIGNAGVSLEPISGPNQDDQMGPGSRLQGMGNGQESPLEQLVSLLAKALVQMVEGQSNGLGGGQQAQGSTGLGDMFGDLVARKQQNGAPVEGGDRGGATGGPEGQMSMEELVKMLLMAMLQMMVGGGGQSNDPGGSDKGPLGVANGLGGGVDGMGGLSPQDLGRSPIDIGNSLMQGAGENALTHAIAPSQDGGGQVTDAFKDLLKLVAKMMDNNSDTFGQASGVGDHSGTGLEGGLGVQNGPSIELSIQMS